MCVFALLPVPGTELPNPLEFPVMRAIKVACVTLMKQLRESTYGRGLVASGVNKQLRVRIFTPTASPPPPSPRRGEAED